MDIAHIKLVIFDVDGTLVTTNSGATFRESADDWQWLPGRLEKCQQLLDGGVALAIASNQGGVAYGFMDEEEVRQELERVAAEIGCNVLGICFTHPNGKLTQYRREDERRKPGPGMLIEAMQAGNFGTWQTLMVGDRPEDEQAAQNAGVAFMWADDFFM